MAERQTISTRVTSETAEKLQTVVDAESVSKAQYVRAVLLDRLEDDHDGLSDEDEIRAKLSKMDREIRESDGDRSFFDPLGLLN